MGRCPRSWSTGHELGDIDEDGAEKAWTAEGIAVCLRISQGKTAGLRQQEGMCPTMAQLP